MIKMIPRAIYSAYISIVLISIILVTWTGCAFVAQPTKSSEMFALFKIYMKVRRV